jgi:hypothetical protein
MKEENLPQLEYKSVHLSVTNHENKIPLVAHLVTQLDSRLNEMAAEGWRVVSVQSVLRGNCRNEGGSSYGYSTTDAFIVVFERGREG